MRWFLLLLCLHYSYSQCPDKKYFTSQKSTITSKCLYLSDHTASFDGQKAICSSLKQDGLDKSRGDLLSIDSEEENEEIKAWIASTPADSVYIGLLSTMADEWQWVNEDTNEYRNFYDYVPTTAAPSTTAAPTTTHPLPPRNGVTVVVAVDGSAGNTREKIAQELSLSLRLVTHISELGPVQAQVFVYGCQGDSTLSPSYSYTSSLTDFSARIRAVKAAAGKCTQQAHALPTALTDLRWYFYCLGCTRQYAQIAMVVFSSETSQSLVDQISVLPNRGNATLITVSTSTGAASLKRLAIPSTSSIAWGDGDVDSADLAENIDALVFPTEKTEKEKSDGVTASRCAHMDSATGKWAGNDCGKSLRYLCELVLQSLPSPTTVAPTTALATTSEPHARYPCFAGYVEDPSDSTRCYRFSSEKLSFNEAFAWCEDNAEAEATERNITVSPRLLSIRNTAELKFVEDLFTVSEEFDGESRFWIGLASLNHDPYEWAWMDGNTVDTELLWKRGYPRWCPGCAAVCHDVSTSKWMNIDIAEQMYAACAYPR